MTDAAATTHSLPAGSPGPVHREVATLLETAMAAFANGRADIALPMALSGLNLLLSVLYTTTSIDITLDVDTFFIVSMVQVRP